MRALQALSGALAFGALERPTIEKVVQIHEITTHAIHRVTVTATATTTVTVGVPATPLTSLQPTANTEPTSVLVDTHGIPSSTIRTSDQPTAVASPVKVAAPFFQLPSPPVDLPWPPQTVDEVKAVLDYGDTLVDAVVLPIWTYVKSFWLSVIWPALCIFHELAMAAFTKLFVVCTNPIVWVLDNGQVPVTPANAAPPSTPNFYGFAPDSHPPEKYSYLRSLEIWMSEPRISMVHLLVFYFYVMCFWSIYVFGQVALPTWFTEIVQAWLREFWLGNNLVWTLVLFGLHCASCGWLGPLGKPIEILGAQLHLLLRPIATKTATGYDYPQTRLVLLTKAMAHWAEYRYGRPSTIRDGWLFLKPFIIKAALGIRSWLNHSPSVSPSAWQKFKNFWGHVYTIGGKFAGKVYDLRLKPSFVFFYEPASQFFGYYLAKYWPANLIAEVHVWWIMFQWNRDDTWMIRQAANMTVQERLDLVDERDQLKKQLEFFEKKFLPEVGRYAHGHRLTSHALIKELNWMRMVFDLVVTDARLKAQGRYMRMGEFVQRSSRYVLAEETNACGYYFQLGDANALLEMRVDRTSEPLTRSQMRRLEDGRCNSWIRNGKHANGVPSLFVDIRHPDERHPWDLKRWFSNIDIPEYKEFREEGLPHSDFEYALIEGKGLEKAKELGYVPDTVPPYR